MKKKFSWYVFGVSAIIIGLYPLIYFFVDRRFGLLSTKSSELLSQDLWNLSFYSHIIFGGIALLVGWVQFHKSFREGSYSRHRLIGYIYISSVLVSALSGLIIAKDATGGWISTAGFAILSIIWFTSTFMAWITIKENKLREHQMYMILSYALCFAAVTLRVWLPLLTLITGDFILSYRIVAWLCWVPNLLFAVVIIKRNQLFFPGE